MLWSLVVSRLQGDDEADSYQWCKIDKRRRGGSQRLLTWKTFHWVLLGTRHYQFWKTVWMVQAILNEEVIRPHVKTRTQSGKLEGNLYFPLSPWLFSPINICTHRFKTLRECWLINTSFPGRVALLRTHIANRIWQKEYGRCISHPFPLGSQLSGSQVKKLESGADRTHTAVLANRKCHGAHCVRHLKEPRGWAFRNAESWQILRRASRPTLWRPNSAAQRNCLQLLNLSMIWSVSNGVGISACSGLLSGA